MIKLDLGKVICLLTYESAITSADFRIKGQEAYDMMKSLLFTEINNTPFEDRMDNKINLVILHDGKLMSIQYWDGKLSFGHLSKLMFDIKDPLNNYRIIPANNGRYSVEECKTIINKYLK